MSIRLHGLLSLGLILGGVQAAWALDPTETQNISIPSPAPAATTTAPASTTGTTTANTSTDSKAIATPAPAASGTFADEISDLKRYFTITCDVREEYDDNINSSPQRIASFKEEVTPSILFSYPMDSSTFDARYTFGYTYYNHSGGGQQSQQDHDVVVRYNHSFSDRFNLDLRDDGGYHVDPDLLSGLGSVNDIGGYYSNSFTAEFSAQWTPLFGTVTSYANNFIEYENSTAGQTEDSDENTVSQDFRFAFWPTVTFAVGGIYDNIDYFHSPRGYSNYTGDAGFDWQALPSLSLGFRVGGSILEYQTGGSSTSPYGSANLNWQLGERSRLIASYEHTETPSDIGFAQGEESDRFSANFLYNVTPDITTHLEGIFSYDDYSQQSLAALGGGIPAFTEDVSSFDTGVTYHYNQYLDFELGYIFSVVDSQFAGRSYSRNQIYVGVRGTY